MSARDEILYVLESGDRCTTNGQAQKLLDAYRTEVLDGALDQHLNVERLQEALRVVTGQLHKAEARLEHARSEILHEAADRFEMNVNLIPAAQMSADKLRSMASES